MRLASHIEESYVYCNNLDPRTVMVWYSSWSHTKRGIGVSILFSFEKVLFIGVVRMILAVYSHLILENKGYKRILCKPFHTLKTFPRILVPRVLMFFRLWG
jgi:hypothetical protein